MLGGAMLGALACLALPRPRHVLRLIVRVGGRVGLAANVWAGVLANGFVTRPTGGFTSTPFPPST